MSAPLEPEITVCKDCGVKIFFGRTPNMANMPLEAKPILVYRVLEHRPGDRQSRVEPLGPQKVFLPHFARCPGAEKFRKGK